MSKRRSRRLAVLFFANLVRTFNSGPVRMLIGIFLIVAVVLILAPLFLALSRSVLFTVLGYLALGSTILVYQRVVPLRETVLFVMIVLLLVAGMLLPLKHALIRTFSLFQTTSQVRSFEGRASTWGRSLQLFQEHPFLGVGPGNFAKAFLPYKSQDDDARFVDSAYNALVQILVEKGAVGFLCYSFLLVLFFQVSLKKFRSAEGDTFRKAALILFMLSVTAVLLRDLSFTSLGVNKGANALMWFMIAANAGTEPVREDFRATKGTKLPTILTYTPVLLSIVLLIWASLNYSKVQKAEARYGRFVDELVKNRFSEAEVSLDAAIQLCPSNALYQDNQGLLQERKLSKRFEPIDLLGSNPDFDDGETGHVGEAVQSYLKAIELSPNDAGFWHNLGWLYCFLGDWTKPLIRFTPPPDLSIPTSCTT